MGLLDLPIIVLRFPQGVENVQNTLALELDATGDVCMRLPTRIKTSVEAVNAFSVFWSGNDKKRFMKLLGEMFNDWKKPFRLATNWQSYTERLNKEFKADLIDVLTQLETFLENPFAFLTEKCPLEDLSVLEVQTRSHNSPEPFVITKLDWKGDFLQTVEPLAIGRPDVFSCHVKGLDLALFIKTALGDVLIKLIKKLVII